MYSPIVVVAIFGLVAMSSAQDSYANSRKDVHHIGYGFGDPVAEAQLDKLDRLLDAVEAREEVQLDRLELLADSANDNLAFKNTFSGTLQKRITEEQTFQDGRLKALAVQIRQIRALRQQVQKFNKQADKIKKAVQESYQERKKIMYVINDLRNSDLAQQNRIEEEQTRVNNLRERITALIFKTCDNRDEIITLVFTAKNAVDGTNLDGGAKVDGSLSLKKDNGDTATFPFDPEFAGPPQFVQNGFNRIEINRKKSHYPTGYASIYFSLSQNLMNNKLDIEAVDMSTGDLSVDHIGFNGAVLYYNILPFPKLH